MGDKEPGHVVGVNFKDVAVPLHAAGLPSVPVWHAEAPSLITHKPVKGDDPFGAEVIRQFRSVFQDGRTLHAEGCMLVGVTKILDCM